MVKTEPIHKQAEPALVITRVFDAPRGLVWKAWTDPDLFVRWWGPKNFTSPVARIDLRVGGRYLNCMRSPEGRDYWSTGVYREIVPMERLVLTDSFSDEKGNIIPASGYGMPGDWPLELLVTVTLEEIDGRTKMTLRHQGIPSGVMTDNTCTGWNESFEKLEQTISTRSKRTQFITEPGKQQVVITRIFDAPRELVFNASTDPNLIPEWWGPKRLATAVDKMDVRRGGLWRFVQRDVDGSEYAFHGVYHEAASPERLVNTFEFEGTPGHVSLDTATFEEHDGKTKLTIKTVYQSVEDRDVALTSGMEIGAVETIERLAALVEKLHIKRKAA